MRPDPLTSLHPKGGGQGRNFRRGPYNHRRWRRIRRRKLAQSPLCEICLSEGRVRPGEVIHHVAEHGGNSAKFFLVGLADLQSLCREHHERLHGRKLEPVQIGVDGWPVEQADNINLKSSEHREDDDDGADDDEREP
jgi:hypothetical protein